LPLTLKKVENAPVWMLLTDMTNKKAHPIAKITQISGYRGEVRLKPLSRYFDELVETRALSIGYEMDVCRDIKLMQSIGTGKKKRFKFEGVKSRDDAEALIGQTVFAEHMDGDNADLISKDLIGYTIVTESGRSVGKLFEILWLPANDVYVIMDGKEEKLIPVIEEIIKGIDHHLRVIVISPMDGLV